MKTLVPCLLLALACLAQAQPAPPHDSDEAFAAAVRQERDRLAAQRAALEAQHEAQAQVCRQRFFVNRCLDALAPDQRQALAALRRQEVQLEQAERQRRQAAALQRIAEKAQAQAALPLAADDEVGARRPRAVQPERADRETQARERAAQQQAREKAAAEREKAREDAARTRAERGGAPLPVPGPAPGR